MKGQPWENHIRPFLPSLPGSLQNGYCQAVVTVQVPACPTLPAIGIPLDDLRHPGERNHTVWAVLDEPTRRPGPPLGPGMPSMCHRR